MNSKGKSLNLKVVNHKDGTRTFIYTVSHLTKPWAFESTKQAIRALAGEAIKDTDKIIIRRNRI